MTWALSAAVALAAAALALAVVAYRHTKRERRRQTKLWQDLGTLIDRVDPGSLPDRIGFTNECPSLPDVDELFGRDPDPLRRSPDEPSGNQGAPW